MAFGACCALSFDEATHYGTPQSQRTGMDALVSFQNDPKSRVPHYACFAQVLRVFCVPCARRPFDLVVHFLEEAQHYGASHTKRMVINALV